MSSPRSRLTSQEQREQRRALLDAIDRRTADRRRGRFGLRGSAVRPPSTGELVEAFVVSRPPATPFKLDDLYRVLHEGRSLDEVYDWNVRRAREGALVRAMIYARATLVGKYGDWAWLRYDRSTKLWYTRTGGPNV